MTRPIETPLNPPQPPTPQALLANLWLAAYQRTGDGDSQQAVFDQVCTELAKLLAVPLVLLSRRQASGLVQVCGRSQERALWLELQRMPERWDGTVAGDGPAARALHAGQACWMAVTEPGFLPWRKAAADEQIAAAGAWPLGVGDERWLLQVHASEPDWFEDQQRRLYLDGLAAELARFLLTEARLRSQSLLAAALAQAGNSCFLTDLEGRICWSNAAFTRLTGYSAAEVLGQNPRFLASGQQGLRYYQQLWNSIRDGQVWSGETIDKDRNGSHYSIRQTISPIRSGERISHYLSVHEDISQQRAEQLRKELETRIDADSGLLNAASFEAGLQSACAGTAAFTLALLSPQSLNRLTATLGAESQCLLAEQQGARVRELLQPGDLACRLPSGELRLLLIGEDAAGHQPRLEQLRQLLLEPYPLIGEDAFADCRLVSLRVTAGGQQADELLRRLDASIAVAPFVRASAPARRAEPAQRPLLAVD